MTRLRSRWPSLADTRGAGFPRRAILHAVAAAALLPWAIRPQPSHAAEDIDPIEKAFLFAFPLVEIARTRAIAALRAQSAGRPPVNILNHRSGLADHTNRNVTTPNNDTLYSAAWLDLTGGPVELVVPPSPKRYASAQLLDVFGDTVAVFGTGNTADGAKLLVAGPHWQGSTPEGWRLVRAPGADLWLIVRVLVDGPDDVPAGSAVQRAFTIRPTAPAHTPFQQQPGDGSDPERFLAVANEALGRAPLAAIHAQRVAAFAPVGIRPGEADVWNQLSPQVRAEWQARMPAFRAALRDGLQRVGPVVDGWSYPAASIGQFGADDMNRARVALGGLGALPQSEAVYLSTRTDATGKPLDGSNSYRLQIPADVPVRAFWSLSMYEIDAAGRLYFTDNAISRYALGNRTAGLQHEPDGGLILVLQHTKPDEPANWLPAPPGPFALTFRAYLPEADMRDGHFRLPAVTPA